MNVGKVAPARRRRDSIDPGRDPDRPTPPSDPRCSTTIRRSGTALTTCVKVSAENSASDPTQLTGMPSRSAVLQIASSSSPGDRVAALKRTPTRTLGRKAFQFRRRVLTIRYPRSRPMRTARETFPRIPSDKSCRIAPGSAPARPAQHRTRPSGTRGSSTGSYQSVET